MTLPRVTIETTFYEGWIMRVADGERAVCSILFGFEHGTPRQ